jgi:ribosomal protein L12E/L44/L45/RPP1/RPP2
MARDLAEELLGNGLKHEKEFEKSMTPNEELFATYYNRGKILVKDMDDTSLREHRLSLWQIATEAKAQLLASDDEVRERAAKKSTKDKEWLASVDADFNTSDLINVVEKRKARMSKMDKLEAQLLAAGIDEATVKTMVSQLERKATDQKVKSLSFKTSKSNVAAVNSLGKVKTATATAASTEDEPKKPNPFAKKKE